MASDINFLFQGKRIIVTGASSGIGKRIALEIAGSGGEVLAVGRNRERLLDTYGHFPERITIAESDVRDYTGIEEAVKRFADSRGRINGLVHAAGVLRMTPLKLYSEDSAREMMDINFWSGIKIVQIASRKRYSEPGSSYVLIASVCACRGEAAQFALNASKASLQTAARTIAKEIYKQGSRINTISPGLILTELTKGDFDERGISESIIGRHLLGLGKAEDVSGMALYLLSDRARWITGQDFVVDGGYLVSD